MFFTGRPLYDNAADAEFFIAPPEWRVLRRAVDRRLNVLLTGGRGVGKTTLLRQLQRDLREAGVAVAFVEGTAVSDVSELAERVRDALRGGPGPADALAAGFAMLGPDRAPIAGASRALANVLRSIGEAPSTCILVDAVASPEAVYALFGRMRDVLWQHDHRWVVAVDDLDEASVLKPPADAFFDVVVRVEPWAPEALVQMLGRRAGDSVRRRSLEEAAAAGGGSPREALRALTGVVVHGRDPTAALAERGALVERASELGRGAGMLMTELLDRGSASPSDESLQATLGLSRSRLTQVLRLLLDHGLVEATHERPSGPGRPRTVYRPVRGR